MKRRAADAAVEEHTKKKFDSLTPKELKMAYEALGIDHNSGFFIDEGQKGKDYKKKKRKHGGMGQI